jgi:hypothetical protein
LFQTISGIANLVGLYTLDESKGNYAWDSSDSANHASFLTANSNGGWTPKGGKINGAFQFNPEKKVIGFTENLCVGDFSLVFWVKAPNPGPDGIGFHGAQWYYGNGLVDGEVSGKTSDFGTSLINSSIAFGVGPEDITIFAPINLNEWVHVAAVRAVTNNNLNNNLYLYINGAQITSNFTVNGTNVEDRITPSLTFGALQTRQNFFDGLLDEIRVYSSALSPDEIAGIYNSEKDGKEPPNIGHEPEDPDKKGKSAATAFAVVFAILALVEGIALGGLIFALIKKKRIPYLPVNNRLLDDVE